MKIPGKLKSRTKRKIKGTAIALPVVTETYTIKAPHKSYRLVKVEPSDAELAHEARLRRAQEIIEIIDEVKELERKQAKRFKKGGRQR